MEDIKFVKGNLLQFENSDVFISEDINNLNKFKFIVAHDFSVVPEQAFIPITRIASEIDLSLNDDGYLIISAPEFVCKKRNFIEIYAQTDSYDNSNLIKNKTIIIKPDIVYDFFSSCDKYEPAGKKEASAKINGCTEQCAGCPCRIVAAGYYKWLKEYKPEELKRQRKSYIENKDKIDADVLFPNIMYSPVLKENEEYPHLSTRLLDRIRADIDNWKYCLYNDDGQLSVKKMYENTSFIEYVFNYKHFALRNWIKDSDSDIRKNYVRNIENNENLFPYLFVIDLLKRGEYKKYYDEQIQYEKTLTKEYEGNSFFGCIVGNDRNEVYDQANKLCEKIRYSFNIDAPNYIHVTATDLSQTLAYPSNTHPEINPLEYRHLIKHAIYLITGLNEFVKIYNSNSADRWVGKRQCLHLLKELTPFNHDTFVILAGEKKEIEDFLQLVPSFELIFKKNTIYIEDMSLSQIRDIYLKELEAHNIKLNSDQLKEFNEYLENNMGSFPFKNSSLAYFLAEETISNSKFQLPTNIANIKKSNFMDELNSLIGMDNIKSAVKTFYDYIKFSQSATEQGANLKACNMHMLFTGNPGTGKTTVARILARALYDIGVIKENKLVEVSREDLIAQYLGQTAPKTKEVINKALNGVLFIDEAYSLYESNGNGGDMYGKEAISTLIKEMEDKKDSLIVIFAGYKKEMENFLDANSGIKSRIGYTFHFEDYSEDELKEMFHALIKRSGFNYDENDTEAIDKNLYNVIKYFAKVDNLGNGRFIDKLYQLTLQNKAARSNSDDVLRILSEDIPSIQQVIEFMPDNSVMINPEEIKQEEKLRVAYHELGHLFIGKVLNTEIIIKRITVEASANGALGYVEYDSIKRNLKTKQMYLDDICRLMAGLAAEQVFMGDYSNGGHSDLKKSTNMAKQMILTCGMGEKGFGIHEDPKESDYFDEINAILNNQFERAISILNSEKEKINKLVNILINEGTIDKNEIDKFLS